MNNPKNGDTPKPIKDVAVYLDFENLYVSLKTTVKMDPNFDLLMEKCREFGRVTVARAYADWSEFTRILTSQMFANGFEPVYVPTRKFYDAKTRAEARKNSVDIHITIDIVKSLFLHENVDVFILISGDRDYVPLINQIRQHGKAVYALGVAGCTSSELTAAVDDMFFYHQLLVEESGTKDQVDVYNHLMRAIRMSRQRGYPTTLGILKPIMKELIEGFDERLYKNGRGQPFQKFKDLVLDAQQRNLVRLVTTGAVSEVFLFGEDPTKVAMQVRRDEAATAMRRDDGRRGGRDRDRDRRDGRRDRSSGRPTPAQAADAAAAAETSSEGTPIPREEMGLTADDLTPAGSEREAAGVHTAESGHAEAPAGPPPGDDAAEAEPGMRLSGIGLDDRTWEVIRQAVESYAGKPPTPRKLQATLREWRDEGRFGDPAPTDGDISEMTRQAVETGKLERVRKGFSTIYRLPAAASV